MMLQPAGYNEALYNQPGVFMALAAISLLATLLLVLFLTAVIRRAGRGKTNRFLWIGAGSVIVLLLFLIL